MKIVFIGWNENGEKCLSVLLENKFNVVRVIVPKGFDTKKMFEIAKKNKIAISETDGSKTVLNKHVIGVYPDLLIVASFHKLIDQEIINYPKYGSINVHAGALPKYRGYHPLNWAIIRDEKTIGVTIHYIDEGADSGDILAQKVIPVSNHDDINSIREKVTTNGAKLLVEVVGRIESKKTKIKGTKQNESEATYAPKRIAEEGRINWQDNSRDIFNLVRALKKPYPNAFTITKSGEKIEIEETLLSKIPGKVLAKYGDFYLISTGDGVIAIKTNAKLKIDEVLK